MLVLKTGEVLLLLMGRVPVEKVKFTSIPMTSAPRVERVDDLVVDSQGLDPPTDKWLQAAREAADTDGIRENAYAERLQMCISCCTLMCMFPMEHGPKHVQSESL